MAESHWAAIERALHRLVQLAQPEDADLYWKARAAVGVAKRRESELERALTEAHTDTFNALLKVADAEARAREFEVLAETRKQSRWMYQERVAELERALTRAIEALDHYTVSPEDAAAMRRWVAGTPTLERELKTANFFRDKLAERLTLVETAVVELEGALGCDLNVDSTHWREHAKHAMESALGLCKRATRVREATGE